MSAAAAQKPSTDAQTSMDQSGPESGKPVRDDKVGRMGTASIPLLITEFAVPAILGMLVNGAYNVIDSIFLGQAMGGDRPFGCDGSQPHHDGVSGHCDAGRKRR